LGNIFLPIIWKAKKVSSTGVLETQEPFDTWIESQLVTNYNTWERAAGKAPADHSSDQKALRDYAERDFIQPVASRLPELLKIPTNALPQPLSFVPQPAFLAPQPQDAALPTMGVPSSGNSSGAGPDIHMEELVRIYERLRDTLIKNGIHSSFAHPHTLLSAPSELTHTDALSQALGFSITAAEIAQRGVQSESIRGTLIDKVSPSRLEV
jgi:E3 ubiquitin-protein ligase UBR1